MVPLTLRLLLWQAKSYLFQGAYQQSTLRNTGSYLFVLLGLCKNLQFHLMLLLLHLDPLHPQKISLFGLQHKSLHYFSKSHSIWSTGDPFHCFIHKYLTNPNQYYSRQDPCQNKVYERRIFLWNYF